MTLWRTTTIEDLASSHKSALATGPFGSAVASKNFRPTGVPMLRGSNLSDDVGTKLDERDLVFLDPDLAATFGRSTARKGDLVFTCWGSVGQIGLIDADATYDEYVVSNKQMKLSPDTEQVESLFLYYNMSQPKMILEVQSRAIGSTIPGFNLGQLRALEVEIPELAEQRAIADVLGALDDKIAANTKLATTSEDLISLHFQHAVGSPGTTSKPLLSVIDFDFGEPFKGAEFSEPGTGRALIRIRDLKTFTSQVWTTEERPREILVQPGDVIVGMDAEFRPTVWLGEAGLLNQRVCRARGKHAGPAFVREALKEPLGRIENYKSATTVIHLNKKDLEDALVGIPSPDTLMSFESAVEALYSQRVSLAVETRTLTATRDALLPQLMSGNLRVKDAEKVLEEVGA